MPELFEAIMVICFGFSWPASILKSWRARTAKGKSLPFFILIEAGYAFGIMSKILSGTITYVFVFYCLNLVMVAVEIAFYFRNSHLDRLQSSGG